MGSGGFTWSLEWTKLGADRVQGRELGYVYQDPWSLVLCGFFFQYQFLKLKRKKKKKKNHYLCPPHPSQVLHFTNKQLIYWTLSVTFCNFSRPPRALAPCGGARASNGSCLLLLASLGSRPLILNLGKWSTLWI